MDFPVIISFYTAQTPYQTEIQNLIASCELYGLKREIKGVDSFGSWELNCAYKPFFIWDMLHKLNSPVLWVDADGVFIQQPSWQTAFDGDFAVRQDHNLPRDHPSKVISSTIFVRPTKGGKGLVKSWMIKTKELLLDPKRKGEFWDQVALRDAIEESSVQAHSMPLAYAKIFDHPGDGNQIDCPVIEHYQASRRFKRLV